MHLIEKAPCGAFYFLPRRMKNPPKGRIFSGLFLDLVVDGMLPAPLAVLLDSELLLVGLLVLARVVVDLLALRAAQLDQVFAKF
jgi:hypothetical protein